MVDKVKIEQSLKEKEKNNHEEKNISDFNSSCNGSRKS